MAAGFRNGRKVVLGYSPYEVRSRLGSLLERYDGSIKAMQYMGFAQAGFPYMGVGRNLGYASEVFFGANGPRRHNHLMSGDDDLLINEVARKTNTTVINQARSFMTTRATRTLPPGSAANVATTLRRFVLALATRCC